MPPCAALAYPAATFMASRFGKARWWQSSPEAPQQLKQAIDRAAHGEFVRYDVDIIGRASGKEIITIDFNIKPVQDREGAVQFLICEGRDVTAQRHLCGCSGRRLFAHFCRE
jgi:PAS fold